MKVVIWEMFCTINIKKKKKNLKVTIKIQNWIELYLMHFIYIWLVNQIMTRYLKLNPIPLILNFVSLRSLLTLYKIIYTILIYQK